MDNVDSEAINKIMYTQFQLVTQHRRQITIINKIVQDKPEKKRKNGTIKQRESIENIQQNIRYILSHINNQTKCKWFKHKDQRESLLDWIKSIYNDVLPTKNKLQMYMQVD